MEGTTALINSYEQFIERHEYEDNISKRLMYAILFKRWDVLADESERSANEIASLFNEKITSTNGDEIRITLGELLQAFRLFLEHPRNKAYFERIKKVLALDDIPKNPDVKFTGYIDTKDFFNGKSALDLFFCFDGKYEFPVLDVVYSDDDVFSDEAADKYVLNTAIQTIPAKQIADHHGSLVLDEVGMGKTVSAIYALAYIFSCLFSRFSDNPPAVLVLCPDAKREDWQTDIMRQLGLHSTIIKDSNMCEFWYFEGYSNNTPMIYIAGLGKSTDYYQNLKSALFSDTKQQPWNMVIIDECHQMTESSPLLLQNYIPNSLKAQNLLMLTATPVKQSDNPFGQYIKLFENILVHQEALSIRIDPLKTRTFTEKDWFVCHYKEDMFGGTVERTVVWIKWSRSSTDEDKSYLYARFDLEVNFGFLAAAHFFQDDVELALKYKEVFETDCGLASDYKLNTLLELVKGENNANENAKKESLMIFCSHKKTANRLYRRFTEEINDEKTLIALITGEQEKINRRQKSEINQSLKRNIADGGRSILITTYQKLGAGMSFGEFDAVVIYELPYTSNRLEQAFGRIERAESNIHSQDKSNKISKKFYLMYNEPCKPNNPADEPVSESSLNPMLEYCVSHIDDTLSAIPARNTIIRDATVIELILNGYEKSKQQIDDIAEETGEFIDKVKEQSKIEFTNSDASDKFWERVDEISRKGKKSLSETGVKSSKISDYLKAYFEIKDNQNVDDDIDKIIYNIRNNLDGFNKLYARLIEAVRQYTDAIQSLSLLGVNIENKAQNCSSENAFSVNDLMEQASDYSDAEKEDAKDDLQEIKSVSSVAAKNKKLSDISLYIRLKNTSFSIDVDDLKTKTKNDTKTKCIFFVGEDGKTQSCTVEEFRNQKKEDR